MTKLVIIFNRHFFAMALLAVADEFRITPFMRAFVLRASEPA